MAELTQLYPPGVEPGPQADASTPSASTAPPPKRDAKARPAKTLPTDRITPTKQLHILRAFAEASGPERKSTTLDEVAGLVGLAANTVALATPFFRDTGLLIRSDGGHYTPTVVTSEFARAYGWNRETAATRLAPALRDTWFGTLISKRLSVRETASVNDALEWFADEASAPPAYEAQVRILLDYLETARIIQREGNTISLVRDGAVDMPPREQPEAESRPSPVIVTQTAGGRGVMDYKIEFHVDMAEVGQWPADRIAAFFNGMAKVVAASQGKEIDSD